MAISLGQRQVTLHLNSFSNPYWCVLFLKRTEASTLLCFQFQRIPALQYLQRPGVAKNTKQENVL